MWARAQAKAMGQVEAHAKAQAKAQAKAAAQAQGQTTSEGSTAIAEACVALVKKLCAANAAIKAAVVSTDMFTMMAKPATAGVALKLIEEMGLEVGDELISKVSTGEGKRIEQIEVGNGYSRTSAQKICEERGGRLAYRRDIVDEKTMTLLVNDGKAYEGHKWTPVLDGDPTNDNEGVGWVFLCDPPGRGMLGKNHRENHQSNPNWGGRQAKGHNPKGPIFGVIEGPPLVALVHSKEPAAVTLVDALIAAAPSKLVPPAILASCTPTAAATALKLLKAYPDLAPDAASLEPLLADDAKRLKKLVFESSCTPLVEALCAKYATIKGAVTAPAMLSELMAPGTAAIALSLINTFEIAVDGELSDALLADNAERLTKLILDGKTREIGNELCAKSAALTATASAPPILRAVALAEKKEHTITRYSTTAHLRKLLTHDPALGGTPIRMVRARWLLEHFQAVGNEAERLEHRQALERAHGDAPFVSGAMLERVLAELESGAFRGLTIRGTHDEKVYPVIESTYTGLVAMSHMCARALACSRPAHPHCAHPCVTHAFPPAQSSSRWLHFAHPDPEAKNLRQLWLPMLEWLYAKRVCRLHFVHAPWNREHHGFGCDAFRAEDDGGVPLSDAAVLERADFGVFIDLASMCQKENDTRTDTELDLFKAACAQPPALPAWPPRPLALVP